MMRVMVVEDEEMIRKGIVMAVDWAALDCIVVGEAANGEQALAVAEDCQPTLIITDLKMPKMDGLTLIRKAVEDPAAERLIDGTLASGGTLVVDADENGEVVLK